MHRNYQMAMLETRQFTQHGVIWAVNCPHTFFSRLILTDSRCVRTNRLHMDVCGRLVCIVLDCDYCQTNIVSGPVNCEENPQFPSLWFFDRFHIVFLKFTAVLLTINSYLIRHCSFAREIFWLIARHGRGEKWKVAFLWSFFPVCWQLRSDRPEIMEFLL